MKVTEFIKEKFPKLALAPDLIEEIIDNGTIRSYKKDTVILKENSFVKHIPLLLSGLVKIYKEEENGNELLLYYIKPGETCIASVISAENDIKTQVKGVIEEDAEALILPKNILHKFRKKYPEWNLFIYNSLNDKFEEVIDMISVITFSNKEKRLMDFLVKKAELNHSDIVSKSHQEIANELGSSREVISRLLKKLEKDNKVKLSLKKITIL